jgi:hypothetical protein
MNWAIRGDKEPDDNKQFELVSIKEYNKLTKYKRVFEILKDNLQFRFIGNCFQVCINNHWYFIKEYNLEKERDEYELLEELMKSEI